MCRYVSPIVWLHLLNTVEHRIKDDQNLICQMQFDKSWIFVNRNRFLEKLSLVALYVYSGGAGGARASSEFGSSEKKTEREIDNLLLKTPLDLKSYLQLWLVTVFLKLFISKNVYYFYRLLSNSTKVQSNNYVAG